MEQHFGPRESWVCEGRGVIDTPCFGPINGHEVKSRSRYGSDKSLLDMDNIKLLCNYHNGWVEDNPQLAHELGLAKHSWED